MQANTKADDSRYSCELRRLQSAFAKFRQKTAQQLKDLSDVLALCRNQLQQAKDEAVSLKEEMQNKCMKPLSQHKPQETIRDFRRLSNVNQSINYPLIAENANLKHQIAQLRSENLRLQQELNRLNGGPSPFQCQPNCISSPQCISTSPIVYIDAHQSYIKG